MVVIGAGPAGLGAAHQLMKLGAEVSRCCFFFSEFDSLQSEIIDV